MATKGALDTDKVRSNAVRALGNLLHYLPRRCIGKLVHYLGRMGRGCYEGVVGLICMDDSA